MYQVQKPRLIIDRKALIQELDEQVSLTAYAPETRGNFLQIFKSALYRGVGEVRRRFEEEGIDGTEVVNADSHLVDQLVRALYDFAAAHVFPGAVREDRQMAIAATGGYGRAELSPFSDIDLMFLLPGTPPPRHKQLIESMLYMLWDMGLKVGHATRTIPECVTLAKQDLTIRTSLIEARWLWGDDALFKAFETRFRDEVLNGSGAAYVEAKLKERDARHDRMGDSRYVLEPNIKEGKGGLRDLQTLFWIAKYLYQVKDMQELVERGVFTAADARHFRQTQEFLWTVRCHLHYVTGRPEERLTFDVQDIIARRLGYRRHGHQRGVERFMKHYFLITKTVGELTRVLCAVLEEEHKSKRRLRLPSLSFMRRTAPGLRIDGGRITVASPDVFSRDPVNLLRLFHDAQRLNLDVHPHALRLVRQSLGLLNGETRFDADANRLFIEMMTNGEDPELTLRRLNEAGVFGRFIPDFRRVVAQMQYDMYHIHTVDEHTIRAIGFLYRIEQGKLSELYPTCCEVVGEIRSRRAMYLAVLLHDIGKGRGGDHSEIGAEIALQLCPRMGLDAWESSTVSWLVRYHLLMSRTAFKRDLDNPKTISDFVATVQSPEQLKMLYVLTAVDISAVGPGVWNAWKAGLLRELYFRGLEEMELTGGQPVQRRAHRVAVAKDELRERLAGWDTDQLELFIARGYSDYWLAFDTETQAYHFEMMRRAEERGERLRVEARRDPNLPVSELTVYTPDHPGLFARLAGALALTSISVVEAKIITLATGMALDTFYILDAAADGYDPAERLEKVRSVIAAAISGEIYTAKELRAARARALPSRTGVFLVPPAVIIDNRASRTHTVIEVNGRDRTGFLHDVTSTLTELGLQIASAHISTYGERVVDVFYVKDVFGLKVEEQPKLRRIERHLLRAIEAPEKSATETARPAAAE